MEQIPNKSHRRNLTLEKKIPLAAPTGNQRRDLSITSPALNELGYPDPSSYMGHAEWGELLLVVLVTVYGSDMTFVEHQE